MLPSYPHGLHRLYGAALLLGLASCAEPGPEIDRVQPNLVDKSVFEGEWWYANTVIDTTYDAADLFGAAAGLAPWDGAMSSDLAFSGGSYPIARIRWVIDEDFLFAYRSEEITRGASRGASAPDFLGEPVAAFAIEDHVDVRQDYDERTGEASNVRVENTSDRRWHERQYMRVDWSENHVAGFTPNEPEIAGLLQVFERQPTSYFVQEGSDQQPRDHAPELVRVADDPGYRFAGEWPEAAGDTVHYMSFVTREVWTPTDLSLCDTCAPANVTLRHAFLRVPPEHAYAGATQTHAEFDRFGTFRSLASTYARGGEDRQTRRIYCDDDGDCAGAHCDTERHICVGGLTPDLGETDFLTFQRPRLDFYADDLTEQACVADWECDGRHEVLTLDDHCDADGNCQGFPPDGSACDEATLRSADGCYLAPHKSGSICDPAASRCTVPLRERTVRPVVYHLSPGFPAHLVRAAFEVVAGWNEVLMQGQRAVTGAAPLDATGVRVTCQTDDPTAYCFCGAPEESGGGCPYRYDPFQAPEAAAELGIEAPYGCHVEGPADPAHPTRFEDYPAPEAYGYRFVGDECMLKLRANSCDLDPDAPCEKLGDLRYHFFHHIDHGAAGFSGVAVPLTDPASGELVVSNANITATALERVGTRAADFFPVLRGEVPEDVYFAGENLRGYFARLGRVQRPVGLVPSVGEGVVPEGERPGAAEVTLAEADLAEQLRARLDALAPRLEPLRGPEGHARLVSQRLAQLAGSDLEARLVAAVGDGGRDLALLDPHSGQALRQSPDPLADPEVLAALSPFRTRLIDQVIEARKRASWLSERHMDPLRDELFTSLHWQYWAEAFEGRPAAEASLRMQQAWLRTVMFHEMGHALGLRHNFAASLDRDHYFDGYFNVAREVPLPSYTAFDLPDNGGDGDGKVTGEEAQRYAEALAEAREQRAARGIGNVMSASTMDYAGDLSDLSGLGRYDRAAVLYNYFDLAEAVVGQPRIADPGSTLDGLLPSDRAERVLWTYYRGGQSCERDFDCPYSRARPPVADQPLYQRCVTNPRFGPQVACDGDAHCVCSSFDADFDAYQRREAYTERPVAYSPVRYLFCSDERTHDLSWCTKFDAGESFREVIEHFRRSWRESYPLAYFRNYQRDGAQPGRARQRIVDAAKIYQHFFYRYYYDVGFRANAGPLGIDDQLFASVDALNWLAELVAMPDVGSYVHDPLSDSYRQVSTMPGDPAADVSLGPGLGHYLWSSYQTGHDGFFRVERAGMLTDKLMALEALAVRDWGLSFGADERFFYSFYDLFPVETTELFGGLILRRPSWYAPRLTSQDGEPHLQYLDTFRGDISLLQPCSDADGNLVPCRASQAEVYPDPPVDGTDAEVLRDYAAAFALAYFPVTFDTSFEQRLAIFKRGSGDGFTLPTERQDGTPTCAYGEAGCEDPDYVVYESDQLHTPYVAVKVRPDLSLNYEEEQLGFLLLQAMVDRQARIRELEALTAPTAAARDELDALRRDQQREESFLEYLIELQDIFGISSWLF